MAQHSAKINKQRKPENFRPIWEIADELVTSVPKEDWASIPHDGSTNYKHYLYGHPKVTE